MACRHVLDSGNDAGRGWMPRGGMATRPGAEYSTRGMTGRSEVVPRGTWARFWVRLRKEHWPARWLRTVNAT